MLEFYGPLLHRSLEAVEKNADIEYILDNKEYLSKKSIWAIGGLQLLAIGIVGEYIGKIYMEVKARPRYIISERTWTKQNEDEEKGE